jgi:hypothetical protein
VSPWWGLVAVLLVSCLLRASIADIPLERDEGEYGYIAERWLAGEVPYQTSFNQKFPGSFLAYGVIIACLGESPAAIHWGAHIWSMGTITLVFLLGRKLFSAPAGVAAAAFAALMLCDASLLGNAANTETFAILFFAASVLAALNAVERASLAWSFAAGVLGAAGMACKQPGVFNLAFVLLYVGWCSKRRIPQALAALAGSVAILGLVCVYFAANGAWGDFYDNTIGHNLSYASRIPIGKYPAMFWENFSDILESFWLVCLLTVWGILGPVVRRRSDDAGAETQSPNSRPNNLLVLVWLAFCCLAVSVGGYYREHYFIQLIPAVALLAGLGATRIVPTRSAGKFGKMLPYVLCMLVGASVILVTPWYYLPSSGEKKCRQLYGANPFPESQDIGRFIAANSSPEDTVLVIGSEPQILYYAKRRSATRYILAYPLMTPFPDTEARQKSVLEEVCRNDPKFIVTVFVPASFLAAPEAPKTLFQELHTSMTGRYALVCAVKRIDQPAGQPPQFQFVTGEPVVAAYKANPMWYDTPNGWATVLVWQRLGPAASPLSP